jgi:hypothetical protein
MGFFNDMKTCTKCKIEKDFSEFYKDIRSTDNHWSSCKECAKQYRLFNSDKIKQYKLNNKNNRKIYKLNNKDKIYQYEINNKERLREYRKQYALKNSEKITKYKKEYRLKNKKILNKKVLDRQSKDPLFKLTCNIRKLICSSIKKMNYTKKSRTFEILGCTFEEFKQHLEMQFREGMTIDNHGKWHMDHIIPISSAKTEEDIIKLNHYTNFQPLWAIDNLKKGNKIWIK